MFEPNQIICGAMPEATKELPNESVNCSISSPPYWALRDYGVAGQLGLEPTFEEYIDKLCDIYDEVWRVLRKDGTCFVNIADTYSGSGKGGGGCFEKMCKSFRRDRELIPKSDYQVPGVPTKSLCCIPERFKIEMINRGWICRNTIIWAKPNPMPSSAKDRFTVDFEYVFFFVKQQRYWFEPQYEPHTDPDGSRNRAKYAGHTECKRLPRKDQYRPDDNTFNPLGRNKRTVWTIPTQPFSEAHFATFPEKLVEPMILSGCPEFVCKKCGMGRRKVYEPSPEYAAKLEKSKAKGGIYTYVKNGDGFDYGGKQANASVNPERYFKGYTDCGCNAGFRNGIVLDPFVGRAPLARWLPRTDETGLGLN